MTVVIVGICVLVSIVFLVLRASRDETVSMPTSASGGHAAPSVESLILAGRKIDAIKLLRAEAGLGLKDAKEEVERIALYLAPS